MTLAGEGWRRSFGIACLTLQLTTIAASGFIIKRYPRHRVLQGRDRLMAYTTVLAQACFLDHSLLEIFGEQWLPCAAFYWLHMVGIPIWVFSQIFSGMRLLRLFEYNEMKQVATAKQQLDETQSQRMKRLQQMMSPNYTMLRLTGCVITMWVLAAVVFVSAGRPYATDNYGCRYTAPPWESQAHVMTDTILDPMFIVFIVMYVIFATITIWIALKLLNYHKKGATESLGMARELFVTHSGMGTLLIISTVLVYSRYSDYPTTFNWIQLPALWPMACCQYLLVLPVLTQSKIVINTVRRVRGQQTVAPAATSLLGVLHDRVGFQYMLLQCRSEFSEENIVALKAIWQFQSQPSFTAMQGIYQCFIEDGAVLQVNISNAARDRVAKLVQSHTADSPPADMAAVFNDVEAEVMKLLENNSWIRFTRSSLYQRYLNGEIPPHYSHSGLDAAIGSKQSTPQFKTLHTRASWSTPPCETICTAAYVDVKDDEPHSSTLALPVSCERASLTTDWRISMPPSLTASSRTPRSSIPLASHSSSQPLVAAPHMQLQAEIDTFSRPRGNRTPHVNMAAHRRTASGGHTLLATAGSMAAAPSALGLKRGTLHRSSLSMPVPPEADWQAIMADAACSAPKAIQLDGNVTG